MAAEQVHVAEAFRDSAVGHDDGDLVKRLGEQRPEIPVVVRAAKPGARIALDGVVEVREAQRIAEEKYRRIVADDVPVSLLSIELEGGAAYVTFRVRRAALAGDGREARKHRRYLADLAEDFRTRVPGDVVRHRESAVCAPALGMHAPFRNHFPVEMRQFL